MSARHRKAARRKALDNERQIRGLPPLNIQVKGKVKAMLRGQRGILRESQFDQSNKVSFYMPGTKVRGKMGPSGWKKLKTWLRKDES